MKDLDTSGYSCPEPVIMTKKALGHSPDVGYSVETAEGNGNWILKISK